VTAPEPGLIGNWQFVRFTDARTRKFALARCRTCSVVREVSAAAFESNGLVPACTNCQPVLRSISHERSFADGIADTEVRSARGRHHGKG
jgi:hypothetical protein